MKLPAGIDRLRVFVREISTLVDRERDERVILREGAVLLRSLIRHDDWLPPAYAQPDALRYRQYLLHCDSRERFCVVSFVWGPGQHTPIHDHRTWGLVGVLRGAEVAQLYRQEADGIVTDGSPRRLETGDVDMVSPAIGDIHTVSNAHADRASISIHVYGANIGAVERATYDESGTCKRFVSGYSNSSIPNLWDRSKARAP